MIGGQEAYEQFEPEKSFDYPTNLKNEKKSFISIFFSDFFPC